MRLPLALAPLFLLLVAGCSLLGGGDDAPVAPVAGPVAPAPLAGSLSTTPGVTWENLGDPSLVDTPSGAPAPPRPFPENGFVTARLAFPTGDRATSVVLLERVAPAVVPIGEDFGYQLRVSNLTALPLDNVAVTETLGDGFVLASSTPLAVSVRDGQAVWVFERLEPHEQQVIAVRGSAAGGGDLTHYTSVTYNALVGSTTRVVAPSLRVHLSAPAEVLLCEEIPVRFTLTNAGKTDALGIRITNALPPGVVTAEGATGIDLALDRLRVGESHVFRVPLRAGEPGGFLFKAYAEGAGGLSAPSNAITVTVREPLLAATLTGTMDQYAGSRMRFDVRVENIGDAPARDVLVRYVIPDGMVFVDASAGAEAAGREVRWRLESLAVGGERSFEVALNAMRAGAMVSRVEVETPCGSPAVDTFESELRELPGLFLDVTDTEDPASVGADMTYVVRAINQGTEPLRDLRLKAILPAALELVETTGPTAGAAAGSEISFDRVSFLAPGEEARWRIVVRPSAPGPVQLRVLLDADGLPLPIDRLEGTVVGGG